MKTNQVFTRILAIAGTALVWFPILVPILLAVVSGFTDRRIRFDYLMPAELFPFALAGGLLLFWAALRLRLHQQLIGWGFGVGVLMLVGGQGLAVITGLASGENEPVGWRLILVLGSLVIYMLAMIVVGFGGVCLLRNLFKTPQPPLSNL
jgi:hypothetical protein